MSSTSDRERGEVQTGERLMQSPITGTWYLVTKWRDKGVGKAQAIEKEEVADEDVPDLIDRLEGES